MTTLPRRATICLNPSKSSETSSTATPSDGVHSHRFVVGRTATLERLLSYADTPIKRLRCVEAWQAYAIHCLDFSLPGLPTSLDVKATTQQTRSHEISSVDQLVMTNTPCIYLASWMIRPVGQGEGWSVMDIVQRLRANLAAEALELLRDA